MSGKRCPYCDGRGDHHDPPAKGRAAMGKIEELQQKMIDGYEKEVNGG